MERRDRYSIRKLTIGAASVFLGAFLYAGVVATPILAEEASVEDSTEISESQTPKEVVTEDESLSTVANAPVANENSNAVENGVYGKNAFDAEYGNGYFALHDGKGSDGIQMVEKKDALKYVSPRNQEPLEDGAFIGTNTERDENVFIDWYNGVFYNGKYYDVREYTWCENIPNKGYLITKRYGQNFLNGDADEARLFLEFHFYEAGTLKSNNPIEITFKGIMQLEDCDMDEGYDIKNGLHRAYFTENTELVQKGEHKWVGTKNDGGIRQPNWQNKAIWIEVEGSEESPLTVVYVARRSYGSGVNFEGVKVNYQIVGDDLPANVQKDLGTYEYAMNAYYELMNSDDNDSLDYEHYEFSGWYYDEALTQKVPAYIMVDQDYTFYGTFTKVSSTIITSVENGTISESDYEVPMNSDKTIQYAPNEGYHLVSVTVDGQLIDIETYPNSYVFENVVSDHVIHVVYKINQHTLMIHYVDTQGNVLSPVYAGTLNFGDSYSVGSPEISGYHLVDQLQTVLDGSMADEDLVFTVVYEKNPEPIVPVEPNEPQVPEDEKDENQKKIPGKEEQVVTQSSVQTSLETVSVLPLMMSGLGTIILRKRKS